MALILHAINVSSGDAILLELRDRGRNYTILIDGGEDKSTVHAYLKQIGIKKLDLVIASHIDYDHIYGLLEIVRDRSIGIGEFWVTDINIFRDFLQTGIIRRTRQPSHILYSFIVAAEAVQTLSERGIPCRAVYEGYSTQLVDLKLDVVYPPPTITDFLTSDPVLRRMFRRFGYKRIPPWWLPLGYPGDLPSIQELIDQRLENKRVVYNIEPMDLYAYIREHQYPYPENLDIPPELQQEDEEAELSYFESQHLMNDTSVVLKVSYGNKTILFPGDLTNWTYVLTNHAEDLRHITVFKVPHHGSYVYEFGYQADWRELKKLYEEFWHRYGPYPPWELFEEWYQEWFQYWHRTGQGIPRQSSILYSIIRPEVVLVFPRGKHPKLPYYETRKHLSRVGTRVLCTRHPTNRVRQDNSCVAAFGCETPSVKALPIYKRRRIKLNQGICEVTI